MKISIQHILSESGPMLSGKLANIYSELNHVTNESARQALSRARSPVQKNKLIPFTNSQIFFYLERQFMKDEYCDRLVEAIMCNSHIVSSIIIAMTSQNGYFSKDLLPIYSFSPTLNLKGHKRFDVLIDKMIKTRLIDEYLDNYYVLNHIFFPNIKRNLDRSKGIEIAKKVVLNDFGNYLRELNVVSYNKGKTISEYCKFMWGYTAPSYIKGISKYGKNGIVPGFIIVDVNLYKGAKLSQISFFHEKVKVVGSNKKNNFVPIFLTEGVDKESHENLKKDGIVIAFIENIFGSKYIQLLDDLVNIVTNATSIIINNPEKIDKLFNELVKSDGKHNNVLGDMFELLVAYYYINIGSTFLEVNKIIQGTDTISGHPREIDVYVEREGKILVVECKATKSQLDFDTVKKWIEIKVCDIYSALRRTNTTKTIEFQIWSVGGFQSSALELLEISKKDTKKYGFNYFDKEAMKLIARENKVQSFIDRINKNFDY